MLPRPNSVPMCPTDVTNLFVSVSCLISVTHVCASFLFVWTLALSHSIIRMYAVAIWAQVVFRSFRTSFHIHTRYRIAVNGRALGRTDWGVYPIQRGGGRGYEALGDPTRPGRVGIPLAQGSGETKVPLPSARGVAAPSPRAGGTSFRVCPQRVPGTRS